MSYLEIRATHLVATIIYAAVLVLSLHSPNNRIYKNFFSVLSLILLLSGVYLLDKYGLALNTLQLPNWTLGKLLIWAILGFGTPILLYLAPRKAKFVLYPWIVFIVLASILSIWRPL